MRTVYIQSRGGGVDVEVDVEVDADDSDGIGDHAAMVMDSVVLRATAATPRLPPPPPLPLPPVAWRICWGRPLLALGAGRAPQLRWRSP